MEKDLQVFYGKLEESRATTDTLVKFYDEEAQNYDKVMQESGYDATTDYCASLLKASLDEYEVVGRDIIDVGSGTGKTGRSLKKAGFTAIDGVDPSEASRKVATATGSYRTVFDGRITDTEKLSSKDESYEGVFCVGCFTVGHIKLSNGLAEFIRILKHGGVAVYTISNRLDKGQAMQDHVAYISSKQIEVLRIEKKFYHALGSEKSYADIYVIRKL